MEKIDDGTWIKQLRFFVVPEDVERIKILLIKYRSKNMERDIFIRKVDEIKKTQKNLYFYYMNYIQRIPSNRRINLEKIRYTIVPDEFIEWFMFYLRRNDDPNVTNKFLLDKLIEYQSKEYNIMYKKWRNTLHTKPEINGLYRQFKEISDPSLQLGFLQDPRNKALVPFLNYYRTLLHIARKSKSSSENNLGTQQARSQQPQLRRPQQPHRRVIIRVEDVNENFRNEQRISQMTVRPRKRNHTLTIPPPPPPQRHSSISSTRRNSHLIRVPPPPPPPQQQQQLRRLQIVDYANSPDTSTTTRKKKKKKKKKSPNRASINPPPLPPPLLPIPKELMFDTSSIPNNNNNNNNEIISKDSLFPLPSFADNKKYLLIEESEKENLESVIQNLKHRVSQLQNEKQKMEGEMEKLKQDEDRIKLLEDENERIRGELRMTRSDHHSKIKVFKRELRQSLEKFLGDGNNDNNNNVTGKKRRRSRGNNNNNNNSHQEESQPPTKKIKIEKGLNRGENNSDRKKKKKNRKNSSIDDENSSTVIKQEPVD